MYFTDTFYDEYHICKEYLDILSDYEDEEDFFDYFELRYGLEFDGIE